MVRARKHGVAIRSLLRGEASAPIAHLPFRVVTVALGEAERTGPEQSIED